MIEPEKRQIFREKPFFCSTPGCCETEAAELEGYTYIFTLPD